ncbi:MAG TPA: TonB-dependent receptor [Candidatus Rubrimentiphilum sp.]|nr:TonB-dependent receptor [Candidatus Rubrimentiphilum sp.]
MPKFRLRHAFVAILLLVAMLSQGTWALAGTTGSITGQVMDATTGKPVADATVTAVSPSQSATATTDAGGNYRFFTLAPDTYTVSATKTGYNSASQSGITVFADQSHTLSLNISPSLRTIANVTARAAGNLVKPGTTADVYSVNAATQQVVSGSGGGFNLNQAYSGIYSQPGVTSYIGNAGWGQVFYIRGSAYSQIGYEFDGVPVNRAFDNYQANSLASLGQQELQVYTGGSPSGASSATLGGFINQVIKTGTYPGFGTLKGGIGAPGFYHALTAEAGGANPNRTFSYYVGVQGYNQHFPAGNWNNLSNIASNGMSSQGILGSAQIANWLGAVDGDINIGPPDFNLAQCLGTGVNCGSAEFFANGPFAPCQATGANAGLPLGTTAANPGPFNGACNGYYPFQTVLSDIYERDNVINLHFALPHKNDSGRDDLQLLYDNSMQYQLNGDAAVDAGGYQNISNLLTPYSIYSTGSSQFPGLCGYENFWGTQFGRIGCAANNAPLPYMDSLIWAPGTAFGQLASTAVANPYYFPNSPTNRSLNAPCSFGNALAGNCQANGSKSSGQPATLKDGFWNDVGIVKAQYTKNIGSNAYARLFAYTFYSDWLISGPVAAGTAYLDGLVTGAYGGDGTADYELTTHTRGAEFQFADQFNPQNLLRLTANYTTASVARWNNGSWESGYAGSRTGVTDWTNGNPANPICYNRTTGQPWNCDDSGAYGTFPFPATSGRVGPTPTNLAVACGVGGTLVGTPGCNSFNAGTSNWLVTVPSGQGTYNTVRPVFTSVALEDEFKPNDKLDLNLGLRYESYQYNLANLNNSEFNFWFNAYAQVLCYDPGTGLPQFSPLTPGQPIPPALKVTSTPLASCGPAPSGQTGLHPTGNIPGCVTCGPLQYTAQSPGQFTRLALSPRVSGTYTLSPDDVLRFSAGKYTQPTETAFEQYADQSGKRAANFDFSRFWGLGFTTPAHDNPIQYSNNYDFSWEHRFHNSDITFKISPFYRDTHNQIETVVLAPGFVSGTNTGHQHSYGVEVGIQKGDPTRDGWSGQLSYTYTNALVQYGNLPSGTNSIDYLNTYISAFNKLTSAGGGSPCYNGGVGVACPANFAANPTTIVNPYFNMASQPLLDRMGWYQPYPNEAPNAPYDQGGAQSAIWPHQFSGWIQYKKGRFAIAPNFTMISGAYYGSPTDTYGTDPRTCAQNQSAAISPTGTPVAPPASTAGFCDFLTAGATFSTDSGYLAIPNPYTGSFDGMGKFQQPWQINVGALIKYDISPRVTANLTLTNILNYCWGGTNTAWSSQFKPGSIVCGYGSSNGTYVGANSSQPGYGSGFYYGTSANGATNGSPNYPAAYNYPFAPLSGALPFQAYLELQIKL